MRVYICSLCLFLASTGVTFAQNEKEPDAQAAFRELICARAADFSSPLQSKAIEITRERGYVDERFDAVVSRAFRDSLELEKWDTTAVSQALLLLPQSTLADKVQTKLVFECYNHAHSQWGELRKARQSTRRTVDLVRRTSEFLSDYPTELMELIKQGLESKDLPVSAYDLIPSLGKNGAALVPLLIESASSDDEEVAVNAMTVVHYLLPEKQVEKPIAKLVPNGKPKVGAKMMEYADRIVSRYDKNKDGMLSKKETESMLMSPMSADLNGDRFITKSEYGAFIQSKSKR